MSARLGFFRYSDAFPPFHMVCCYKVAVMEEYQRENDRLALIQRYSSAAISVLSFWVITLYWNWISTFLRDYVGWDVNELGLVTRLGFSAALSWVVFLHAEVIGMIIMSMMKDKWQAEARAQARYEAMAEMVAKAVAVAVSEAVSAAVAREAAAQETIRDLKRQLREARGEEANGADGGA